MTYREHEPDVRFRFGNDAGAVRQARDSLKPLFCEPYDVIADDVRLATSEMVTNVIVHTGGGGEMRAWDSRSDVPVRVEVEDGDQSEPVIADVAPAVGGRGISIVAAISDNWGFEASQGGKIVWAEFDRNKRRRDQADGQNVNSSG